MAGYIMPRLVIDADTVSGSFGKLLNKYVLAEIIMVTEKDENSDVVP